MTKNGKQVVTLDFLMEAFKLASREKPCKITLEGPHGIGKTALILAAIQKFKEEYGEDLKFWQVSVPTADPIHIAGLPEIVTDLQGKKSVSFIALNDLLEADIIFFDELTRPAGPEVTNAMFELVNQGTINGEPINARIIIGAYNPGDVEGYDTMPLDPAFADRFEMHFTMSHLPDAKIVGELLKNEALGEAIASIGRDYDQKRREARDTTVNDSGLPYISPRKWVALGKNWQCFGRNNANKDSGITAIQFSFECITASLSAFFGEWDKKMREACKNANSPVMAALDVKAFQTKSIELDGWKGAGEQPFICSAVREEAEITNTEHFLTFGGEDQHKRLYLLPYLLRLENNLKAYIAQINEDPNSGSRFDGVRDLFNDTINDLRILKKGVLDVLPNGVFSDSVRLRISGENQAEDGAPLEHQSFLGAFRMPYALKAFKEGINWSGITDKNKLRELEDIVANAEKDLASVFDQNGGREFFELFIKIVNSDSDLFKILTTATVDELKGEMSHIMDDPSMCMNESFNENKIGEVVATAKILDIMPTAIQYVDSLFTAHCFDGNGSVVPPTLTDSSINGMLTIDSNDDNQIKRVEYDQFKEMYQNVFNWMNETHTPETLEEFFPTLKG